MKKLFVSVPMEGRTKDEINKSIQKMKQIAEIYEGEELELIDSYIEDNPPQNSNQDIWHLGESLNKLAQADVFIVVSQYWEWNNCSTETAVALRYGVKMYQVDPNGVIDNYKYLKEDIAAGFSDRIV